MYRSRQPQHGFNTQPPEGGWLLDVFAVLFLLVSTHSRPKAAGYALSVLSAIPCVSTHSRPKAAGSSLPRLNGISMFQHTAARRRLVRSIRNIILSITVSTHSRPKAAGFSDLFKIILCRTFQHTAARRRLASGICSCGIFKSCFNTQPPEGGWTNFCCIGKRLHWFQHTAARRRLDLSMRNDNAQQQFQHTAARRRLVAVSMQLLLFRQGFNTQPPEGGWKPI